MTSNLTTNELKREQVPAWRVIVTRPRFEKQVGKRLKQLGVEYYLPLRRDLRQWHDRKKWVEVPLFSNYLFVRISDAKQNLVFEAEGVLRYLRSGGKLACLRQEEIARIERICRHQGELYVDEVAVNSTGQACTIPYGEFEGLEGIQERRNGKPYLKITLPLIFRTVWLRMAEDS